MNTRKVLDIRLGNCIRAEAALPKTFVTPLCNFDHFSPCARAARATTVQVGTGHLSWQLLTCGSNTSQNFCNTAVATLLPQQKLLTAADVHLVG